MTSLNKAKNIFLTGATGLLGLNICKIIILESNDNLVLLLRGKNVAEAFSRFNKYMIQFTNINYKLLIRSKKRIKVFIGDVSKKNLKLSSKELHYFRGNINEIFHCAALAEFRQPLERVREINVQGTENLLIIAGKCSKLKKINYVSTAFIAGKNKGSFDENDFNLHQKFNNTYEQSKFEAEKVVRRYIKNGLRINIFRPSIIVGSYRDGLTNNFRMFYQPLRSISMGILDRIPISKCTVLNLIPADVAAKAMYEISKHFNKGIFHIVSPKEFKIMYLMNLAKKYFGYKNPIYSNLKDFNFNKLTVSQNYIIKPYIPYFNFRARFKSNITRDILEEIGFEYPDLDNKYLRRLFKYAEKRKYIKSYK